MSRYTSLKTFTGRELLVRANKRERTFRIKTASATFKTLPMSRDEFISCENMTGNDWQNYLTVAQDYYRI